MSSAAEFDFELHFTSRFIQSFIYHCHCSKAFQHLYFTYLSILSHSYRLYLHVTTMSRLFMNVLDTHPFVTYRRQK